jgi:hypothetical protein
MISSLQHWFVFKIAQSGMCVSPSSSSQVSTTGRPVLALGSWNTDVVCKTHEKIIYWTQTTFPKKKFLTPPSLEVCVYLTSLLPCWIAAWMTPFCPPTPPPPSTAINRAVHGTLLCALPFDAIHRYQCSLLSCSIGVLRAHTHAVHCVSFVLLDCLLFPVVCPTHGMHICLPFTFYMILLLIMSSFPSHIHGLCAAFAYTGIEAPGRDIQEVEMPNEEFAAEVSRAADLYALYFPGETVPKSSL